MFPKGPRFKACKESDTPGPNSYNIQNSPLDPYKRCAFLEKTDRFSPDVELNMKPTLKPGTADRFAALQRKLEDLERVHNDGKKAHQTEVDHLKSEHIRLQKSNAELADRMDKMKKLNDTLDVRVQDLKKAASSDRAEIKDLRFKLRMSDHERTQMATKQGEAGELKKSLQSLESRRKDEVRERDRRIADLEKALAGEKKKREDAETKHVDLNAKTNEELLSSRVAVQKLETLVNTAQAETREAQSRKAQSDCKEGILVTQLEQHQLLLGQVAEEYGRLVSRTVPISVHTRLKMEHTTLATQSDRLERKLAWSQVQVVELTAMIRDAKEQIRFLTTQLHETEADASLYHSALVGAPSTLALQSNSSLENVLYAIHDEIAEQQHAIHAVDARSSDLASQFYHLAYEELRFAFSLADKQLHNEQLASQQHAAELSRAKTSHEAIAACLETVQHERRVVDERLKTATALTDELRTSSDSIARQLKETEERMLQAAAASDITLRKEKDTVQRLTSAVQKSRMAEEALRSEIEMLTTELTDAERYQEAYHSLSEEVGSLVARNQLAEEEAQRLSTFNAEILSHKNPAQRIMYVDRIRRELAETKHKLVMLTHEQENVVAENGELQHELGMYKSVMVPAEHRPRTNLTRVTRAPLVNQTQSLNTESLNVGGVKLQKSRGSAGKLDGGNTVQLLESIAGDMTLDEIM